MAALIDYAGYLHNNVEFPSEKYDQPPAHVRGLLAAVCVRPSISIYERLLRAMRQNSDGSMRNLIAIFHLRLLNIYSILCEALLSLSRANLLLQRLDEMYRLADRLLYGKRK